MKYTDRFLETLIVLSSDSEVERERKDNLGMTEEDDDESESESVVDLLDVSVLFKPLPLDSDEPQEDQCAIILKSGRTIWVKTPFSEVKSRHQQAIAAMLEV